MYHIKEMFYSLQGEGAHTGRPAIFLRFSGCNLWNGKESHRKRSICTFCDTDFIGTNGMNGGKFKTANELATHVNQLWPTDDSQNKYVICTGGEPALQIDDALVNALKDLRFEVGIETNGTLPIPSNLDWICVSPKGISEVVIEKCNELKLVFPQPDCLPERFDLLNADIRYLSPLNNYEDSHLDPSVEPNTQKCIQYCLDHPSWRLCLQTHKVLNID